MRRERSRSPVRPQQPSPTAPPRKIIGFGERKPRAPGTGFSSGPPPAAGGFSTVAPAQPVPRQSTAEILEKYKQYNPQSNLSNHNKSDRQLYVGNIPLDISTEDLTQILNKALIDLGKPAGIFQGGNPVVGCWISGDGHYAFVDFRTPDEAT